VKTQRQETKGVGAGSEATEYPWGIQYVRHREAARKRRLNGNVERMQRANKESNRILFKRLLSKRVAVLLHQISKNRRNTARLDSIESPFPL